MSEESGEHHRAEDMFEWGRLLGEAKATLDTLRREMDQHKKETLAKLETIEESLSGRLAKLEAAQEETIERQARQIGRQSLLLSLGMPVVTAVGIAVGFGWEMLKRFLTRLVGG